MKKNRIRANVFEDSDSLCMVMDVTKNTNKKNSKLQADIRATRDSVNKLKAQARKAFKSTQEHFLDKNENRKMEHAQLAEFAATTNKNLMIETNCRMEAINSMRIFVTNSFDSRDSMNYGGKTETTTIQPDIVPPDIMVKMKTAKTSKRKLDNTDINKFGDRPS